MERAILEEYIAYDKALTRLPQIVWATPLADQMISRCGLLKVTRWELIEKLHSLLVAWLDARTLAWGCNEIVQ